LLPLLLLLLLPPFGSQINAQGFAVWELDNPVPTAQKIYFVSTTKTNLLQSRCGQCSLLSRVQFLFSPSKHSGNIMYYLLGNSTILLSSPPPPTHTHCIFALDVSQTYWVPS
jgi:hypothetical protein